MILIFLFIHSKPRKVLPLSVITGVVINMETPFLSNRNGILTNAITHGKLFKNTKSVIMTITIKLYIDTLNNIFYKIFYKNMDTFHVHIAQLLFKIAAH